MEIIRLSIYHTVNADTLSAVVFPSLSPQVLSTNFPISYMIHEYSLFWKMLSSKKENKCKSPRIIPCRKTAWTFRVFFLFSSHKCLCAGRYGEKGGYLSRSKPILLSDHFFTVFYRCLLYYYSLTF